MNRGEVNFNDSVKKISFVRKVPNPTVKNYELKKL
jgi:hypothetical protein